MWDEARSSQTFPSCRGGWYAALLSQSWHSWDFNSAGPPPCRGDKQR